jgi:hypothetical protein
MKVVGLDEYKGKFLEQCQLFYNTNDRNKDWFNPSVKHSIPNAYMRYPHWTFLLDSNDIFVAMSCVQTHFFPSKCARVLTRTFYQPEYRRHHLSYEKDGKTPAMFMLEKQIEWIDKNTDIQTLFFSVEYLRRKSSMQRLANKLNAKYLHNWQVADELYQTYPVDEKASWQSVCIWDRGGVGLPMNKISVEEWGKMYA